MSQEDIKKEYNAFGIPADKIPHYENPGQFSTSFRRCSLYEYVSITYSGSASIPCNNGLKEE